MLLSPQLLCRAGQGLLRELQRQLLLLLLPQLLRCTGRALLLLLLMPQLLRRAGRGLLPELQLQQLLRRAGRGLPVQECILL